MTDGECQAGSCLLCLLEFKKADWVLSPKYDIYTKSLYGSGSITRKQSGLEYRGKDGCLKGMAWPLWSCTSSSYGYLHHICIRLTCQHPMKIRQGNWGREWGLLLQGKKNNYLCTYSHWQSSYQAQLYSPCLWLLGNAWVSSQGHKTRW